jgi:hypothetical protein
VVAERLLRLKGREYEGKQEMKVDDSLCARSGKSALPSLRCSLPGTPNRRVPVDARSEQDLSLASLAPAQRNHSQEVHCQFERFRRALGPKFNAAWCHAPRRKVRTYEDTVAPLNQKRAFGKGRHEGQGARRRPIGTLTALTTSTSDSQVSQQ